MHIIAGIILVIMALLGLTLFFVWAAPVIAVIAVICLCVAYIMGKPEDPDVDEL